MITEKTIFVLINPLWVSSGLLCGLGEVLSEVLESALVQTQMD